MSRQVLSIFKDEDSGSQLHGYPATCISHFQAPRVTSSACQPSHHVSTPQPLPPPMEDHLGLANTGSPGLSSGTSTQIPFQNCGFTNCTTSAFSEFCSPPHHPTWPHTSWVCHTPRGLLSQAVPSCLPPPPS